MGCFSFAWHSWLLVLLLSWQPVLAAAAAAMRMHAACQLARGIRSGLDAVGLSSMDALISCKTIDGSYALDCCMYLWSATCKATIVTDTQLFV